MEEISLGAAAPPAPLLGTAPAESGGRFLVFHTKLNKAMHVFYHSSTSASMLTKNTTGSFKTGMKTAPYHLGFGFAGDQTDPLTKIFVYQ